MAIPQTFNEAFARAKELVSIFNENEPRYLSPGYSEAQARLDFIDKFWIALGWDVNHEEQTDPYKQEAKVERGVATSEFRKRADYAFLAPNFRDVRFFVEAKKPHAGIDTPLFYFQTIRYGWNSHVPISVLHDFEEMRVLDCRYKPNINTVLGHVVLKYHYTDYANEQSFRTIYYLFSREAVTNGSVQEFAKGLPKISRKRAARGVATDEHQSIDESFLQELDEFREELARAYKRKNPDLDSAALTEVTQRTLDRLVFMRFLEDKLIESDLLIEDLHKKGKSWENFIATSRRLDRVYNGIIFKEHSLLDSDKFNADEKVFDKISQSLSHRESPYDFNAIPIHILGSIYERFLGKVIVATAKQARVEDKPEVRKAGGVYYTPEYIVRYIVENTVGKLIEGKTPAQIQEMRFADIACGSGSFLLGVYDTLLRYHAAYYNRTKKNREIGIKAGGIPKADGTLQLSLLQKRQILINNIYGVDIDPQAVEVAQLSLYLKLLEDETIASAKAQQRALHAALLPSLSKNIVCGNSLIGWDILEGKLFDSGEERKLNPMNFEDAFPEVMKRGGFDAIVGNPPWGAEFGEFELDYHRQKNAEIIVRMIDSFMYFVYRASRIIKENGAFGMILPDVILYQGDNEKLRRYLLRTFKLETVLNMGDVFDKVTRPTAVVTATHASPNGNKVRIGDFSSLPKLSKPQAIKDASNFEELAQREFVSLPSAALITSNPARYKILGRIREVPHEPLVQLVDQDGIQRGVSPDLKEAFIVDYAIVKQWSLERNFLRRVLTGGRQVKRYYVEDSQSWLIYTGRDTKLNAIPNIRAYIDQFASRITCKEVKEKKHSRYSLHRAREEHIFTKQHKFLGVITEDEIILAPDDDSTFATDGLYLFGIREGGPGKYVMAILNSRLFVFIYRLLALEHGRVLAQVKPTVLNQLPIRTLDLSNSTDKAVHDRIVQLVDQMLEGKKQLASAQTERDQTFYESKCATLDRQIDQLVYELYDLTPEEIAIVEGATYRAK